MTVFPLALGLPCLSYAFIIYSIVNSESTIPLIGLFPIKSLSLSNISTLSTVSQVGEGRPVSFQTAIKYLSWLSITGEVPEKFAVEMT